MAKKQQKPSNSDNHSRDLSLQDKVDGYMDPEANNSRKSAPLLPGEKINQTLNTDRESETAQKQEQPQSQAQDQKQTEPEPQPVQDTAESSEGYDDWPDPNARSSDLRLESSATNKAVDEIVAAESDKLLDTEDKERTQKQQENQKQEGRLKSFLKSKKFLWLVFWILLVASVALMTVPTTRYFILNTLGVRASTTMRVVDAKTKQPLSNVGIVVGGQEAQTNEVGEGTLQELKLGPQEMSISKPAFATIDREVTIGWGSNPLGDMELTPVGVEYEFNVTGFLSDEPIVNAEAKSGNYDAISDKNGKIVLVVEETDEEAIDVVISAEGYREETIQVTPDNQQLREVTLVPSKQHAFVSKRSGTYDLYKTYIDGQGQEVVLEGTGSEVEDELVLVNHPTEEMAAFVSIRGDVKNNNGELLSTLQIVNLGDNQATRVVSADRVQVIDWVGDRLVYIKEDHNKKIEDPGRNKLMSYNYTTGSDTQLAQANYFNDVSLAKGIVYYSPAGNDGQTGLYSVYPDGTAKNTISEEEVWNIFRTNYNNLRVSIGEKWHNYDLSSGDFSQADGPPTNSRSRIYYDSPDRNRSLWSENRDGKGTLIVYEHDSGEDNVIYTESGLGNPLRWLDDEHVIFRVDNGQEIADYAMSLNSDEAKKIADVTNVTGIDRWYSL